MFNTRILLRRDNDYNYAKIKDTFIPLNGEICLVDTAREGLRVVCGDGHTPFGELKYVGEFLVQGYYKEGKFYEDKENLIELPSHTTKIYIDKPTNGLYYYDGFEYVNLAGSAGSIPTASASHPGIMKLYTTIGDNEDGTMTQKAITDELDDKVEVEINKDEELLIFTY